MRMFHVATRSGGRDSERYSPILRGEAPCFNTAWVRTGLSALYQRNRSTTFPLRARRLGWTSSISESESSIFTTSS
jgi:hypothetical protein